MPAQHPGRDAHLRRERSIAAVAVVLLVIVRSIVFVFWEQSYFDSDQAIIGLMAKHLAELRAFPLFYYGQNYMLGVEAYLAAPVFLIAGVSVASLKLPLLALNIAIAVVLLRLLEREAGLRPALAIVPVLFFAIPSPAATAQILAANGGNLAPFVYALLIWTTRARPGWCGFFFGLGFLQREFTIYALLSLIAVEACDGSLFTREGFRRRITMFRTAAEVWLVVQWLKYYSSAAGPGTSMANIYKPRDNLLELAGRICGDLTSLPQGALNLATSHWPALFGTRPIPLGEFGIESSVSQGLPGSSLLLAAVMLVPAAAVTVRMLSERRWHKEYDFPAYLLLVGVFSAAGYVIGRCGQLEHFVLRYELLSILGLVGLGSWSLVVTRVRWLRGSWVLLACALAIVAAIPHLRVVREYARNPPAGAKQVILNHLEARGIRYATSDYWLAYALTFLSEEKIIVASEDFLRIPEHNKIVEGHKDEAVRVSRTPCPGGRPVIPGVYLCEARR
jgi:hypothetical protein